MTIWWNKSRKGQEKLSVFVTILWQMLTDFGRHIGRSRKPLKHLPAQINSETKQTARLHPSSSPSDSATVSLVKEVKQTFVSVQRHCGTFPGVRHATAGLQIYRDTFGGVRAVGVDKSAHNACHPITTKIYLPDRHISLQGPVCRLALEQAAPTGGTHRDRTGLQTAYYHQFDTVDS